MSNTLAKIKSVGDRPIITRTLDLGEFDSVYAGATFEVNVP